MYVYVSWAYTQLAEEVDAVRKEWIEKATKPEGMTEEENKFVAGLSSELCLPEYHEFLTTLGNSSYDFFNMPTDKANRNLLAVRFVVPALGKISTLQLAKRMPGGDKQPVSLAARAFLLNTFPGEWTKDLQVSGANKVTFVGFKGLSQFMVNLAIACGALDSPLPIDCWMKSRQIELCDDSSVRQLMESCAFVRNKDLEESEKYKKMITGWMGTGASADRDSTILLSTAFKLGLKDS
jgi:hypothetical protein